MFLLHRSVVGRGLYAIGLNSEGARYAGIPVRPYLALVYLLSRAVAGVAAIIYVSHLGLANPILEPEFELQAITAIVIGGTSIFGGRGDLFGTLLGLLFLCALQNGLHLLATPSEATGVLTGVLLIVVIAIDLLRDKMHMMSADILSLRKRGIIGVAVAMTIRACAWVGFHGSRTKTDTHIDRSSP